MTTPNSSIAIVGAGVFGLSTALHLATRGYKSVTVFDYQPYHLNAYDPADGCDAASADVNKIYRCSYGNETEYQDLAFSGRPIWLEWNAQIAQTPPEELPRGVTPDTKLFVPCGYLRLSNGEGLSEYDKTSLELLDKAGLRHHQHVLKSPDDMTRLASLDTAQPGSNWTRKAGVFSSFQGGTLDGYLDTSAGLTYADKSCIWARHLCERAGVRFVLGEREGRMDRLIEIEEEDGGRRVVGLKTRDGKEHFADVVVIACGGWTPSVLPQTDRILQATAGSVCTIQLPPDRQDLWDKFSPDNFPVWAYGLTGHVSDERGGLYGFPRTPTGQIKIGYRGKKWVNFQPSPSSPEPDRRISVPKTKYTADRAVNLPRRTLEYVKEVVGEMFPELKGVGITDTRMCWYTDSPDSSFLISYLPSSSSSPSSASSASSEPQSLFVASGGSGHGFKFLPVLGHHVVNALEGTPDQFTELWEWPTITLEGVAPRKDGGKEGEKHKGFEEGEMSGRNLEGVEMASEGDWVWAEGGSASRGGGAVEVGKEGRLEAVQVDARGGEMRPKAQVTA